MPGSVYIISGVETTLVPSLMYSEPSYPGKLGKLRAVLVVVVSVVVFERV